MPQNCHSNFPQAIAVALLIVVSSSVQAQQPAISPATDNWRPNDGWYAQPGPNFDADCDESGYLIIALGEMRVGGDEWDCKVTGLTDTAAGTIRLDLTCSDYNLAGDLRLPEDKEFREVMYLKKIDGNSMLVRKSANGKLKYPTWRAAYCREEIQRSHREQIAKEREDDAVKAEWERKASEERKAIEARKAAQDPAQPK